MVRSLNFSVAPEESAAPLPPVTVAVNVTAWPKLEFGKEELMSLCEGADLRLVREWPSIPYDVSDVTGHRSSTATYLFEPAR